MSKIPMYQYKPVELGGTTSGQSLKFLRELRELSIESLSDLSGIPAESIRAVEENSAVLSAEQIERIALAADCHPSSIAFPHWSPLPYEPEEVLAKGAWKMGEAIERAELKLYYQPGHGLSISNRKRKSIRINPFNGAMTLERVHAPFHKTYVEFSMSGSSLGTFHDAYGGGSEFDTDTRTIRKLGLKISYYRSEIAYEIDGIAADEGLVSGNRPADSPPGDWIFAVRFAVPARELRRFYGLYPSAEEFLLKKLSVLDEAPDA